MRTLSHVALIACLVGSAGLVPAVGQGAPGSASAASTAAAPSATVNDAELLPLPTLAPVKRAEPSPDAQKELEALLNRLHSDKADIREAARTELDKAKPELVPAVYGRVQQIRESLDRDRAPKLLEDARKAARKARKEQKKSGKAKDDDDDGDWLLIVMSDPKPKNTTWQELVELLAMVRILSTAGTTPAVRELIELRGNFGDMLRIDLARQIDKLKDKAVPALLEATKHDAATVRQFASKKLDDLGKVTPGEAVSVTDPDVLADTLRAFGVIREVEAVDVLLSFANHDRKKVRDAAREAIAAIGEPGRWRLRDAYQDLVGEKVDKSVPWDLLARRIFGIYDKARVAELWGLFTSGLAASKAQKPSEAVAAFDKVLARDPLFDRKKEMAPAYFEHAKTIPFENAEVRLAALRKARRLCADGPDANLIEAEIAFSEAKVLIAEGRPERYLLKRATELDPTHTEARELLASFEEKAIPKPPAAVPRYTLAGGIGAAAALLIGFIAFFRRRKPPGTKGTGGSAASPSSGDAGKAATQPPAAA